MDYKQLAYFICIASEKSFSKAANKLFLSQQALSKSMERLEEELNVALFIRSTKGTELTKYGEELRTYAFSYLQMHENIINSIKTLDDKQNKTLSIGYPTGMLTNFPPDFISNFMLANPDIHFKLHSYADDSYNRSIQNTNIDIHFCSLIYNQAFINIEYASRQKVFLICNSTHPLAKVEVVHLSDLTKYKLLVLNNETTLTNELLSVCKNNNIYPDVYLCPSEIPLSLNLVLNNNYISFFGTNTIELPSGLIKKEVIDLDLYFEFLIVTHKNAIMTSAMKEFIKYTKKFI